MLLSLAQRAAFAALCFFSVLLTSPTPTFADDTNHVVAHAWFEDPSNKMTFTEVRDKTFTPYRSFLSKGFGESTIWIRITIDPHTNKVVPEPGSNALILKIRPLYLDEIELFDPLYTGDLRRITGDRFPARTAEYQSLNFNFVIPRGEGVRDIYLRLKSTSTRLLYVEAYHLADLQRDDRIQQLFFGLYLALVSLFLVWAAISWLTNRDRVISAFLATQCVALVLGLSIFGYVRDFFGEVFSPEVIDEIMSYSSVSIVACAVFFYIRFWEEYKPAKSLTILLKLSLVAALINLGLLLAGQTRSALQGNMILVLLTPIITFLMVFTAKGWATYRSDEYPLVPKWLILLYFSTNLIVLLAGSLPGLGIVDGGAYSIYVGLTHGIINGAFAVGILQYRIYLLSKKRANLAMDLALAQKEVTQERAFREERERLLAMLVHELRTPLATVRMLVGQQQIDDQTISQIKQSVSEMNSVIQRSIQTNQLDEARLKPEISEIDVVDEISHLVHSIGFDLPEIQLEAPASLRIKTDPQLFRVISSNLIENAYKYRKPGSMVTIQINPKPERHCVEFVFENEPGAAGFPDPEKVYDKYYRSPMAHRQTGSGLGMYLVKGFLNVLKGKIDYLPTKEKVRFVICLPDFLF